LSVWTGLQPDHALEGTEWLRSPAGIRRWSRSEAGSSAVLV
jgi:hypothetical protein